MQSLARLSPSSVLKIEDAIVLAERRSSAEFKVIVTRFCWGSIQEKARSLFYQHGLHQTASRNAILILVVLANREFLVFGDEGIHQKVGTDFWLQARDLIANQMKGGNIDEGICAGLEFISQTLEPYFPALGENIDEISNQVLHGE